MACRKSCASLYPPGVNENSSFPGPCEQWLLRIFASVMRLSSRPGSHSLDSSESCPLGTGHVLFFRKITSSLFILIFLLACCWKQFCFVKRLNLIGILTCVLLYVTDVFPQLWCVSSREGYQWCLLWMLWLFPPLILVFRRFFVLWFLWFLYKVYVFNWSRGDLQCFKCTAKWFSYKYIHTFSDSFRL